MTHPTLPHALLLSNCGRDATARWDEDAQAWDLGGVFDNSWDGCGGDDPGLDEVEIGEGDAPREGALLEAASFRDRTPRPSHRYSGRGPNLCSLSAIAAGVMLYCLKKLSL